MAVTLTEQADDYSTLSSAIFKINNSDTGSGTVEKTAGYQVKDGSNNTLVDTEEMPNTGSAEAIDVAQDLRGLVSTPFPGISTQNVTSVSEYTAAYKLAYGEISFDSADCSKSATITTETSGKNIVNAYLDAWEDADLFNSGDLIILSNKPTVCYVGANQSDYMYFFRSTGSVFILLDIVYTDGSTVSQSTSIGLNGSAGYISCGPGNLFFTPTKPMAGYTIEVHDAAPGAGTLVKSYTFKIENLCEDEIDVTTLYWLNQKGGWESLELERSPIGVIRQVDAYISPQFSNASGRNLSGGYVQTNLRFAKTITLIRQIPREQGNGLFFDSIVQGREFYVKYFNGEQFIAHRFELEAQATQGVDRSGTTFQLAGRLNNPF